MLNGLTLVVGNRENLDDPLTETTRIGHFEVLKLIYASELFWIFVPVQALEQSFFNL